MGKLLCALNFLCGVTLCHAQASITSYNLDFSFDFAARKVFCKATISITKADTVNLLLYRLLTIRSVRDNSGAPVTFSQNVKAFEDWDQFQVNSIQILPGEATQLTIEYDGYLAGYTETGMLYTKDRIDPSFTILRMDCFAYPVVGMTNWEKNNNVPETYFNYTVSTTVPDSLTVVNGGKLVDKKTDNGNTTYTYTNVQPAWRIDVVVAKYETHSDKDFILHYFPEDSARVKTTVGFVKKAFATYGAWFGKHSEQQYTIIEIPDQWGSQADVTSILQEASAIKDEKHLYELYHEISHTWNVTPLDSRPGRLESEGLATFLQYLTMEKLNNIPGALDAGAERQLQRVKRQFDKDPKAATVPIAEYGAHQLTDLSYSKGMLFFYMLYKIMGEERMMSHIAGFYKNFPKGATLKDFTQSLGSNKKLIDDWIWTDKSSELIRNCKNVGCLLEKRP